MLQKNTRVLIIVFAAFVLLAWGIQYYNDSQIPEVDPLLIEQVPPGLIFDFDSSQVQSLTIRNLDGGVVTVKRTETGWWLPEPATPEEFTDQVGVAGTIGQLAGLRALETGGDIAASLSLLGLEYPPYQMEITLTDGTVQLVRIGNLNPLGSAYYFQVDNAAVVLVPRASIQQIIAMIDLPPVIATPEPEIVPTSTDS